jgi:hypothetical protein
MREASGCTQCNCRFACFWISCAIDRFVRRFGEIHCEFIKIFTNRHAVSQDIHLFDSHFSTDGFELLKCFQSFLLTCSHSFFYIIYFILLVVQFRYHFALQSTEQATFSALSTTTSTPPNRSKPPLTSESRSLTFLTFEHCQQHTRKLNYRSVQTVWGVMLCRLPGIG